MITISEMELFQLLVIINKSVIKSSFPLQKSGCPPIHNLEYCLISLTFGGQTQLQLPAMKNRAELVKTLLKICSLVCGTNVTARELGYS